MSQQYTPDWESIDSRPVPAWFDDAKFGIFIHWGLYSVPAWAKRGEYAEWYWECMKKGQETWDFHKATYGEDFQYQDFVKDFTCDMFDPDQWADLFARAGARYIVPTSRHHDGFCLWPSGHAWNWNSVDVGPHRDLMGELTQAVRARDMKMGFYYSLYEWYRPLYLESPERYALEHMIPQLKDVVERYSPSIIFTDGEWDHPWETWHSPEFLAWLFNESPCRDDVVINDRWGKGTRSEHGGYYTTEYGEVGEGKALDAARKWEECRGIGASFGYNRNETSEDYLSSAECIHLLADMVSKGGNLLLNIGPTADGRVPEIQQERLLDMGAWLDVNGRAIYETHPWKSPEGDTRFTMNGDDRYCICLKWPKEEIRIDGLKATDGATVSLLGSECPVDWECEGDGVTVRVPCISPSEVPCNHAWTLQLSGFSAKQ